MKIAVSVMFLSIPLALIAQPKILIDAIPTGAEFAGVTPFGMPFKDAETASAKKIEAGINGAVDRMIAAATQQGFSYICFLSAPGDKPVEIPIAAAKSNLKLSRRNSVVLVAFYRGGHEGPRQLEYLVSEPESKGARVSVTVEKIAVPKGSGTADWIYFNLSRFQAEAEKAKTSVINLSVGGTGPLVAVPIPGCKQALMVPDEKSKLTASWRMEEGMAQSHKGEILGHTLPSKTKQ